jgi:thiol-disulfide isomerase/thioredoxin
MLKKLSIAVSLIMIATVSFAQTPVEVTGSLKKKRIIPVKLFKVVEGKPVEMSSTTPTDKGQFGFLFYPEYEGLYVIGTGNPGSPSDNYKFYFKGGEKLSVALLDSSYVLTGKLNSKENIVLSQWHNLVNPIEQKAVNFMKVQSTFVDYFPLQEEIVAKTKNFLNGKATGNAKFDKNIKQYMAWDLASYATNFLNTPRSAHPAVEELSPYYETLKAKNFTKNTASVYAYPWGNRTIGGLISLNMRQDGMKFLAGVEGVKTSMSYVLNDTLKGDIALERMAGLKSYENYDNFKKNFGQYFLTKSQKKRDFDILTPLATLKPGDAGLNFKYPDVNGKMVSLSDLKGKVVVVDVWATWCGPCIAEIPSLKKLEEEMKGKDVQIISLSTDAVADKGKWLQMIKDKELGGLQLFAGGPGNEFSTYYKVNTIPRFLVFDKAGKIVSVDSARPSNPLLKEMIEKELAK